MIIHPLSPLYDENSKTLILGSFPSVKSREENFFYAHPHNRFWRVVASVFNSKTPSNVQEKTALILNNNLALYDVIYSCDINLSQDSSIKNVVPADIATIIRNSQINRIFVNGKTAENYYNKLILNTVNIPCIALPSTSPANATFSLEKLINVWKIIK